MSTLIIGILRGLATEAFFKRMMLIGLKHIKNMTSTTVDDDVYEALKEHMYPKEDK